MFCIIWKSNGLKELWGGDLVRQSVILICGVLKKEQTLSERTAREMNSTAGSQVLGEAWRGKKCCEYRISNLFRNRKIVIRKPH